MDTAIVKDANSPTRGSTPAMIENEIASGISARATTRPARTSVRNIFGDRRVLRTEDATEAREHLGGTLDEAYARRDKLRNQLDMADEFIGLLTTQLG